MKVKQLNLADTIGLENFENKFGNIKKSLSSEEIEIVNQVKDLLVFMEMNLEKSRRNSMDAISFITKGSDLVFYEIGKINHPFKSYPKDAKIDGVVLVINYEIDPTVIGFLKDNFKNVKGIVCPFFYKKNISIFKELNPNIFVYADNIISRKRDGGKIISLMGSNSEKLVDFYVNNGKTPEKNIGQFLISNLIGAD